MGFSTNSNNLSGADDIALSNPLTSDTLIYNSTLAKWQNKPSGVTKSLIGTTRTAAYTLAQVNAGETIPINTNVSVTITAPSLETGTKIDLVRQGAGAITIAPSGVTFILPTDATPMPRITGSKVSLLWLTPTSVLVSGDLILASSTTTPPVALATESWTGTDNAVWPAQWTTTARTGTIDIFGGQGRLLPPTGSYALGPSALLAGMTALTDAEVLVDVTLAATLMEQYANISLRSAGGLWTSGANMGQSSTGYTLSIRPSSNRLIVYAAVSGANISGDIAYTFSAGTQYRIRYQVIKTTLAVKIWPVSASEPSAWTWSGTGATDQTAGKLFFSVNNGNTGQGLLLVDNVSITDKTEAAPPTAPVSSAMPVGNLPGFTQVTAVDFTTPVALGSSIESVYPVWAAYPDGAGNGKYQGSKTTSVHDSYLDIWVHHDSTLGDIGAAGVFRIGSNYSSTYGRYSARFKITTPAPGYGGVFQLWPNGDVWSTGEMDFPEGDFGGSTNLYHHEVGSNPQNNYLVREKVSNWTDWHVFATEWTPSYVKYYMDDVLVAQVTDPAQIGYDPHNFVFQTASHTGGDVPDNIETHVLIDWVVAYNYTP